MGKTRSGGNDGFDSIRFSEFDLIAHVRERARTRDDVILGIGDDAALLRVPAGKLLVVATDTLNVGVHFPDDTAAADIGWKALAVNLSDLAAMGAEPAWCTLSLSLPESDSTWVDGFLDGFLEVANAYGVALVGGDTARGPLSICVTAHGFVDADSALRRAGAQVGDDIWVSGTLGDAAAALALLLPLPPGEGRDEGSGASEATSDTEPSPQPTPRPSRIARGRSSAREPVARKRTSSPRRERGLVPSFLLQRLERPTPRVGTGLALAGIASACIDLSDGLLADIGHVCLAGGVAAEVEVDALPASAALKSAFAVDARRVLQASGGDDYELCFTAAGGSRAAISRIAQETQVALNRIGRIVVGQGVRAWCADGSEWLPPRKGYAHFA